MSHLLKCQSFISGLVVAGLVTCCATDNLHADEGYLSVVTIYNKTGIKLNYQLRARMNGTWSDWKPHTHWHPNGGWHWHSYHDADAIEIRFDRIGGDDEYTAKTYNVDFYRVSANKNTCRHKGRPYKFEFDRGGRLLDLYRYHH